MNTAKYVDEQIQKLKSGGIPLSDAAWQAALLCVGWPYIFGDRGEYCTPAKRKAVYDKHGGESLISKCQVLKETKASCSGCKWYPEGCRVRSFDCRGFTYWILLQIYGWKLQGAGATSQWNTESNWKAKGTIDTIPEDTLVCLFKQDSKNKKVMAHTGLGYRGETCECSNGVQHFKTRDMKWTHWALPACVEGDVPPGPEPTPPGPDPDPEKKKPTLRRGSTGPYVVLLQRDLMSLGYDVGATGADGKYGAKTEAAVKAFQKDHPPLKADGICGPATWAAIDKALGPEPVPTETWRVTIPGLTKEQAEELCGQWSGATMEREST